LFATRWIIVSSSDDLDSFTAFLFESPHIAPYITRFLIQPDVPEATSEVTALFNRSIVLAATRLARLKFLELWYFPYLSLGSGTCEVLIHGLQSLRSITLAYATFGEITQGLYDLLAGHSDLRQLTLQDISEVDGDEPEVVVRYVAHGQLQIRTIWLENVGQEVIRGLSRCLSAASNTCVTRLSLSLSEECALAASKLLVTLGSTLQHLQFILYSLLDHSAEWVEGIVPLSA